MRRYVELTFIALALIGLAACESTTSPDDENGTDNPGATIDACISTTPSPADIRLGDSLELDASCSRGDVAAYVWNLGDGRTMEGPVITPDYPEPGTYTVTLEVRNGSGAVDTEEVEVVVRHILEACFDARPPSSDFANITCTLDFDASCSLGNVREYRWFFEGSGDDRVPDRTATTDEPTISHSWQDDRDCFGRDHFERLVRLTVVDEQGFESTVERMVGIN